MNSIPWLASTQLFFYVHLRDFFPDGVVEFMLLGTLMCIVFTKSNHIKITKHNSSVFLFVLIFYSTILASAMLSTLETNFFYVGLIGLLLTTFSLSTLLNSIFLSNKEAVILTLRVFTYLSTIVYITTILSFFNFYFGEKGFVEVLYIREGFARAKGFIDNPNYFSIICLLNLFIACFLWKEKKISIVHIMIISLATLATMSRGAVIAIIIFYLLSGLINFRSRKIIYVFFIVSILVFIAVQITQFDFSLIDRAIERRIHDKGGGASARLYSLEASIIEWASSIQSTLWGLGAGAAIFDNVAPHNTYVRIVSEFGLISFIAFGMIVIQALYHVKRCRLSTSSLITLLLLSVTNDYYLTKEFWLTIHISGLFFDLQGSGNK